MRKMAALLAGAMLMIGMATTAHALTTTVNFSDTHNQWPGYTGPAWADSMDVIGKPDYTGGYATITNGALAKINFTSPTINSNPSELPSGALITAGDLFIDLKADGKWDYVVHTNVGIGAMSAGNYNLYDVSGLSITDADYKYGYVRTGQPVGLTDAAFASANLVGSVYFAGLLDTTFSTYFDFGNNSLALGNRNFIIAWTETCGNDVIYEEIPVPEPGTIVLLGAGLLGLGIYGRRRAKK